jgi:predicted DsbA family dithiol-disulfide isomerase
VARAQAPGAVTVVEFVDFECPFCRAMQARLEQAVAQTTAPVRIVRKMVPLPQHPGAAPAALAYCCAELQGRGEEMAKALFAAPPGELTPEGCASIAERVGCDLARYQADMPAAARRVASDLQDAGQAGVQALPTLFIGGERITGASASTEQLTSLLKRVSAEPAGQDAREMIDRAPRT